MRNHPNVMRELNGFAFPDTNNTNTQIHICEQPI